MTAWLHLGHFGIDGQLSQRTIEVPISVAHLADACRVKAEHGSFTVSEVIIFREGPICHIDFINAKI